MTQQRWPKKLKRLTKEQEAYASYLIRQLLSSPRLPITVGLSGGAIFATLELPGGRICFTISDPGSVRPTVTVVDACAHHRGRVIDANYWKNGSDAGMPLYED